MPFEDATAENIEDEMKKVSEVEKDNEEKYVEVNF